MTMLRAWLCRFGWHRDIVRESRTFHRKVTDEGESIDAHEQKECRCGHLFEYEQHTTTRSVSAMNASGVLNIERAKP